MHRGYVKLWRKAIESTTWLDDGLWKVWCWCLIKANWEAKSVSFKAGRMVTVIDLQPGQFVFGRKSAAVELRMKESSVRNRMARLESIGNVDIHADRHYSVVTICNWSIYADEEKDGGQAVGLREDTERTQRGHSEACKKVKKKKEYIGFETFYDAYPRHVAPKAARSAFQKAMEELSQRNVPDALSWLTAKAAEFAKACSGKEKKYIPHPATWLNEGRYDDEESDQSDNDRPYTTEELQKMKFTFSG